MSESIHSEPTELGFALLHQGWYRQGDRLVSPNGTLWLPCFALSTLSPRSLLPEVWRKLSMRRRHRDSYQSSYDFDGAMEDAQGLLEALNALAREPQSALELRQAS